LLRADGTTRQVVAILNEMSPDDRTALLEELPSACSAPADPSAHAGRTPRGHGVARLPRRTVWAVLMTPDFIQVKRGWTVQHVLDYVRQYGPRIARR